MYEKDEKLITTEKIGSKKKGNFIPKGTEVVFIKASDSGDLSGSLIAFKYKGKTVVTSESNISVKNKRKNTKAFHETSDAMYLRIPRLRRYHYNYVKRAWYLTYYFFADLFGGKSE